MTFVFRGSPSALRAAVRGSPRQLRTIYTTREHVAHTNFPFSYENKRKFTAKFVGCSAVAFGLPFFASWYQLRKSAGGSN